MLNIYNLHTNPEQLGGYENRLRVPQLAYEYGKKHGFTDELVSVVVKDPKWAYRYASDVINKNLYGKEIIRWPEGEAVIAKDPEWALEYAYYIIKGRWPEAEPVIATDPRWADYYARYFGIKL